MLLVRCDRSVPGPVEEALRTPLEHAAQGWSGLGEAYVYCVPDPRGPRELVVRVSTLQGVVPVLFTLDHLDPEQVETVLKGTLERGDL